MVKNPPCNGGDTGSVPGWETKIPHVADILISGTTSKTQCSQTDKLLLLFSVSVVSNSLWPHGLQHTRLPCSSLSLGVCPNSCPLSQCDAIQPSHPLSPPSFPAFSLSQHQGLFQWVISSHQLAKVLEFQLQHQSFQWIFRIDYSHRSADSTVYCAGEGSRFQDPYVNQPETISLRLWENSLPGN